MLKFDVLSPFLQKTGTHTHPLGGSEEKEMDGSEKQSHGAEHTERYRWTEILMQSQAQGEKQAHITLHSTSDRYMHHEDTS